MSRMPEPFATADARRLRRFARFGPFVGIAAPDSRYDDGDTLWFQIDCGFRQYQFVPVRLWGIDAPELPSVAGRAASRMLQEQFLPRGTAALLATAGSPDKYGRWLAVICIEQNGVLVNVNWEMQQLGLASPAWEWSRMMAAWETLRDAAAREREAHNPGAGSGAARDG